MEEKIKVLTNRIVDAVSLKIKRAAINSFHKFNTNIGLGADGTVTKYVDKLAEDVAIDVIKKSKIKVNVLSEEIGYIDNRGKYTVVIDPIDGTQNAVRGIPFYSISVAVGKKSLSDVEYGIVKNIPTGDVFQAEKGYGAFLNGKRICAPELPEREVISSLALGKNYDKTTIRLARKGKVRSLACASLEMCMVAAGALDIYVVGKDYLRCVDIAASTLIVREAGGFVTDIYGIDLDMPFDLNERTSVIAACNLDLIKKIVKEKDFKR